MKKLLAMVLVVALLMGITATTLAVEKSAKKSALMLSYLMNSMTGDEAYDKFWAGEAYAYVDDDGDVMMFLNATSLFEVFITLDESKVIELLSGTYSLLSGMNEEHGDTELYMTIWDRSEENILYTISPMLIVSLQTYKTFPNVYVEL